MRLPRKYRLIGILLILFIVVLTGNTQLNSLLPKDIQKVLPSPTTASTKTQQNQTPQTGQTVTVEKITDGDTIEIDGGIKLRYIGINAPESVDPRRPVQCFGKEASQRNKELVEGKTITIEKDVNETDKYGRLLRYVYVGDTMINEQLVREGYALASAYPPDIKYQERLKEAEKDARINKRGLWGKCPKLEF